MVLQHRYAFGKGLRFRVLGCTYSWCSILEYYQCHILDICWTRTYIDNNGHPKHAKHPKIQQKKNDFLTIVCKFTTKRDGKLKEHIALENAKCINIVLEHIIMFAKVHVSNSWSSSILNIIVKYCNTESKAIRSSLKRIAVCAGAFISSHC
jgi:hypothetical protein